MIDWLRTQLDGFPFSLVYFEFVAGSLIGLTLFLLAKAFPNRWRWLFDKVKLRIGYLSQGTLRPYGLIALLSLSICLILGTLRPPVPLVHDEFAYLLGADTFAQGRLVNPGHPMWPHFESNHILTYPVYAPKYPPGQAILLAAGQVLTGNPAWGLWLGFVAATTAVFWMMAGYLPRSWAFLAALLTALNGKMIKVWAMGFMGGTVAFLGGALVFGALPRLWTRWRTPDAVAFAFGSVILLLSRPFEGTLALIPAGILFLIALTRQATRPLDWCLKALPAGLIVGMGLIWLGFYHYRVTGSPSKLPYEVYSQTYELTRSFVVQPPRSGVPEAALRHPTHHTFIQSELRTHAFRRTPAGFFTGIAEKLQVFGRFYIGFIWLLPLLMFVWSPKTFWQRFAFGTVLLVLLATFVCTFEHPHYIAPIGSLLIYLSVSGLRTLYMQTSWPPVAQQILVATIVLAHLSETVAASTKYVLATPTLPHYERILARLTSCPEPRHLVMVKYASATNHNEEWVYNRADIDSSPIVWAHAMGPNRNRALLQYFRNRKIWLFEPHAPSGQRLTPLN